VRTAYTRGFHPKPDMTFGPALSLGVASLDEYLDVSLVEAPEPDELVRRLQATSSSGLRFVAAVPLQTGDPAVSAVVSAGRYLIAFAESALRPLGGRAALWQKVSAFLAKSEHVVRRNIEGVGKLVDVRRFTLDARLGDSQAEQLLRDAGLVGTLVALELTLAIGQTGSAKVSEFVESVFGEAGFPHHAVRVALLAGSTTPLDVAAFRRPPPSHDGKVAVSA
jgi:radical SAM-linked protein